jgi:hypothetical protein
MSHDDVLLGYRLQLFDLAGRAGVTEACRTFGVHRSSEARRRVARELAQAGWQLERVLCDKGNEFRGEPSGKRSPASPPAPTAERDAAAPTVCISGSCVTPLN